MCQTRRVEIALCRGALGSQLRWLENVLCNIVHITTSTYQKFSTLALALSIVYNADHIHIIIIVSCKD